MELKNEISLSYNSIRERIPFKNLCVITTQNSFMTIQIIDFLLSQFKY